MRKNILYVLFLTIIITLNISCNRTEDDLFDKSPAERMNEAISSSRTTLTTPTNGWIVDYFPNPDSIGFTYAMKFDSSGKVKIATRNKFVAQYKEVESDWDVIGDMSVVLTFNSYNDIFHIFSDPRYPGNTGEADGVGFNGDYEFLILSKNTDEIVLKGKKHAAITIARPMPVEQNWEEYFNRVDEMNNFLFTSGVTLHLTSNERDEYSLKNGHSQIFTLVPSDGNEVDDSFQKSFKTTDFGIRFAQALEIGDKKVQNFRLNAEKTKLVAEGNDNIAIIGANIIEYIIKATNYKYYATKPNVTGSMTALFTQLNTELISAFNNNYALQSIGFLSINNNSIGFLIRTQNAVEAQFNLPISISDGKLKIDNFDANNFPEASMNPAAKNMYPRVAVIKQILESLKGSYNISSPVPFTLKTIVYEKSDASFTLTVSR